MTDDRAATLDRAVDRRPPPAGGSWWLRPRLVVPLAAVVAAAAGAGAVVLRSSRAEPYAPHPASVQTLRLPGSTAAPAAPGRAARLPVAPAAAGRTPEAAVRAFLTASRRRDDSAAFALLAPAARRSIATVAEWRNAQGSRPRPTAVRIAGSSGADVRVGLVQQPALDPLTGFVPGRLSATYRTVRTSAGWRVLPDPVAATPVLPAAAAAAGSAARWLALQRRCDAAGAVKLQASADLLGDIGFATQPCSAGGSWRAGAATTIVEGPRAQPFLAAYGSGVGNWARVVPVSGPGGARFLVALAPLGAQWRVFGLVRDGTGGSGVAGG